MTPDQLNSLGQVFQALAVLIAAIASLYAAIHGRANGAKIDNVTERVRTVQAQTNGLATALATATGNSGFSAGVAGADNPTAENVSSLVPAVLVTAVPAADPSPPADPSVAHDPLPPGGQG